jgi:hypothetical protein
MVKVMYLNCALVMEKFPIFKYGWSSLDQFSELIVAGGYCNGTEGSQRAFFSTRRVMKSGFRLLNYAIIGADNI